MDMKNNMALNQKQEAFCRFITTLGSETFGNATQSAISAGYKKESAGSKGCQLRVQPKLAVRIEELERIRYLNNLDIQEKSVIENYKHDRTKAREMGEYGVAKDITTKLAEIGGLFKQRTEMKITVGTELPPNLDEMTASELEDYHTEKEAQDAACLAYKLKKASKRTGIDRSNVRDNPVKFVPSVDVNAVQDEPYDPSEPDAQPSTYEKIDDTERVPAHLVGRGPNNRPNHSAGDWE